MKTIRLPKLKKISFKDPKWLSFYNQGFNEAITQVEEIMETGKTIYEKILKD